MIAQQSVCWQWRLQSSSPLSLPHLRSRQLRTRVAAAQERPLTDLNEALRVNPKSVRAYVTRALVFEKNNDAAHALLDFKAALALPALDERSRRAQETTRARVALLTTNDQATRSKQDTPALPAKPEAPDARLALVIGNGPYVNVTRLPNPPNDARAIARALREIGFEVLKT